MLPHTYSSSSSLPHEREPLRPTRTSAASAAHLNHPPSHPPHHAAHHRHPPRLIHNTLSSIRCFLSTPFAVLTFIVVTIVFLYLLWHPLLSTSPVRVVMALEIEVPSEHAYAPVLVTPSHDLAEVQSWSALSHHHQKAVPNAPDPSINRSAPPPFSCYGVHAQRGRRPYMEDTYAVYLNHQLHYSSASNQHLMSVDTEEGESEVVSPWSMFGVFDGHGGELASEYAASYLLPVLHSSLLHHGHTGSISYSPHLLHIDPSHPQSNITHIVQGVFEQFDEELIDLVTKPKKRPDGSTALVAGIYYSGETKLKGLESTSDQPLSSSPFQLVVANLGDCRAIMIRPSALISNSLTFDQLASHIESTSDEASNNDGAPSTSPPSVTPLSIDHKPNSPIERKYIESHPRGFVTPESYHDVSRVQGILATSRAFGDYPIKPYVRNIPDVQIIDLENWNTNTFDQEADTIEIDESTIPSSCDHAQSPMASDLLLIASDGFWDTFTNEEAADAIVRYLATHDSLHSTPSTSTSSSSSTKSEPPLFSALASHLVKQAYLKGSMDNITVMVVHLECIKRWMREKAEQKKLIVQPLSETPIATDA